MSSRGPKAKIMKKKKSSSDDHKSKGKKRKFEHTAFSQELEEDNVKHSEKLSKENKQNVVKSRLEPSLKKAKKDIQDSDSSTSESSNNEPESSTDKKHSKSFVIKNSAKRNKQPIMVQPNIKNSQKKSKTKKAQPIDEDSSSSDTELASDSETEKVTAKKLGKSIHQVNSTTNNESSSESNDSDNGNSSESSESSDNDQMASKVTNKLNPLINSKQTVEKSYSLAVDKSIGDGLQVMKKAVTHSNTSDDDDDNSDDEDDDSDVEEEDDDDNAEVNEEDDITDHDKVEEVKQQANKVEDEFTAIKKELANMPLEDLIKIKEKLGLKVFNKIMHGDRFDAKKKTYKRENKNRPMEMSSKRPVPIIRNNEVPKEKIRRDPRFDDLSGEFQERHFDKNYGFISDIKAREKQLVAKKLEKTKDEEKKKSLGKLLMKMDQQSSLEEKRHQKQQLEQKWKNKERQLIKSGKNPYFLKKAEKKKLELAEKFRSLEKSGKVDQYLSKRHKKNAQKEKKKLPSRHQRFN